LRTHLVPCVVVVQTLGSRVDTRYSIVQSAAVI
jgi:hypothetical protein